MHAFNLRASALRIVLLCPALAAPLAAAESGPVGAPAKAIQVADQSGDAPPPAMPRDAGGNDGQTPVRPLADNRPQAPTQAATESSSPRETPPAGEVSTLSGVTVQSRYKAGGDVLYLDERRTAANVTEALGAEQIARTGDSDVATTLKRVTGLSLVDGKYVYVRGLGERYSSVLLNGAPIPSPDFTRRVVPLDLFPTELLDGILVDKTYSPVLPGDFGGGTVRLRTREVPDAFFFKAQGGLGYVDGTTGEDGLRYRGAGQDWTGYDDGARSLPDSLAGAIADGRYLRPRSDANPDGATPAQLQTYGRDLAASGFGIGKKRIDPDTLFSIGIGDGFNLADDVRLGLIAASRYKQSWDSAEEVRHTYAASNAGLSQVGNQNVDITQRDIDSSLFFGVGLNVGNNHRFGLTHMLLRQTEDRAKITDGTADSVDSRYFEQKWTENQLRATQLNGHHAFPRLHDLEVDWQYTRAAAGRKEPDTRRWRYDYAGEVLEFSRRSDSNAEKFATLQDHQSDYNLRAMLPFNFDDGSLLNLAAGAERTTRDRASAIRTFVYQLAPGSMLPGQPGFFLQPIDQILSSDNIGPDGFVLRETTRATDNYSAAQAIDAAFFNVDF
ncbi:MAG: TonB-dependent receptor plug domain-containing protein, partial [Dokdonella sp.]|uniref:TonB-dependent receptor plug domain-containing protein n=1 Tax=Dokdonella sp. TaxID=2291710 RepID=UPI003263010F